MAGQRMEVHAFVSVGRLLLWIRSPFDVPPRQKLAGIVDAISTRVVGERERRAR